MHVPMIELIVMASVLSKFMKLMAVWMEMSELNRPPKSLV